MVDEFDFSAAMREAEAEAGVTDQELYAQFAPADAQEVAVEDETSPDVSEETAERPRNEKGQFVAADAVEEPADEAEVEAEAETDETAEDEEETPPALLAGKYKTVEDLERAYREAQEAIDRQGNELGELRRLRQDFDSLRETLQTAAPQTTAYTADQFEDVLSRSPAHATQLAFKARDEYRFQRAWQEWDEVSPGSPQLWYDNQVLRDQVASIEQRVQAGQTAADQVLARGELQAALDNVSSRHTDFAAVVGTLTDESLQQIVAGGFPVEVLQGMNGDMASKERVFETLYRWVKAEQADTIKAATTEAAARRTEASRQAKKDATVATSTKTAPPEAPLTEEERMMQAWGVDRVEAGWTGQSSRR